jgi:hypothetical protein
VPCRWLGTPRPSRCYATRWLPPPQPGTTRSPPSWPATWSACRAGVAEDLARTALRLHYGRPEPGDIATSHHNLASYLGQTGGDRAGQGAHRLAAALICQLTGMTHDLADTQRALADEVRADADADLPATLVDVIEAAERTDGVRLGELLAALQPDPQGVEQALAEILGASADPPAE